MAPYAIEKLQNRIHSLSKCPSSFPYLLHWKSYSPREELLEQPDGSEEVCLLASPFQTSLISSKGIHSINPKSHISHWSTLRTTESSLSSVESALIECFSVQEEEVAHEP